MLAPSEEPTSFAKANKDGIAVMEDEKRAILDNGTWIDMQLPYRDMNPLV